MRLEAYEPVAKIVERGLIADFPDSTGGEWGLYSLVGFCGNSFIPAKPFLFD